MCVIESRQADGGRRVRISTQEVGGRGQEGGTLFLLPPAGTGRSWGWRKGVEDLTGPAPEPPARRGSFPTYMPGPPPTFHTCKWESCLLTGAERPPPGAGSSPRNLWAIYRIGPHRWDQSLGLPLAHTPEALLTQPMPHWAPVLLSAQRASQSTTSLRLSEMSPPREVPPPPLHLSPPSVLHSPALLTWLVVSLTGTCVP